MKRSIQMRGKMLKPILLFASRLGTEPVDDDLKEGMLGL